MSLNRVRCFFDIEVDGVPLGRVIFELFNDVCPKTCENFRALCTGEKGHGKTTSKPLHYKNVKFHRVIKDFMVQAGDFSAGNGTGGESIYGGQFEDENFDINHDTPFLLSMANRGKDTNGSQFFITTQTASHLDGKHVVFGRVISGQEVVVSIENLPIDNRSRPLQQAIIANCGELILQIPGQLRIKEKKKKKKKTEEGELEEEKEEKKKKKKKKEKKHKHKKGKQSDSDDQNTEEKAEKEQEPKEPESASAPYRPHPLASVSAINPDEIPEVPKNRFLDRGFQNRRSEGSKENFQQGSGRMKSKANVRFFTKSGRKVKGRGLLRYRTPSRSRSRSRSATPPHWRQAQRRTVTYEKYQRQTEEQQVREKEIEERRKRREERHRLQQSAEDKEDADEDEEDEEEEGEWKMPEGRIGSVIQGKLMNLGGGDTEIEDKTARDWRVARHETLTEDKENREKQDVNRKEVKDLRQKLRGKIVTQSFTKGPSDSKRKREDDTLDLDDTALDYEAPSENEEDDIDEEGKEEARDDGEYKRMRSARDKSPRDRDRNRDRERERGRYDRFRARNWRDRSRGGRVPDRDRERRGRGFLSRDRRRDSRERRNVDDSRDRSRPSGRQRDRDTMRNRRRDEPRGRRSSRSNSSDDSKSSKD